MSKRPPPELHDHDVNLNVTIGSRNSIMAILSLIFSLCSVFFLGFAFLPAFLGAILGHVARSQIHNDPNLTGDGMALAGVIIGWLVVLVNFSGIMLFGGLIFSLYNFGH